jgi:prophage antirepressor-like protein
MKSIVCTASNAFVSLLRYGKNEVRTVVIDGEPWFVASDACVALGLDLERFVLPPQNAWRE